MTNLKNLTIATIPVLALSCLLFLFGVGCASSSQLATQTVTTDSVDRRIAILRQNLNSNPQEVEEIIDSLTNAPRYKNLNIHFDPRVLAICDEFIEKSINSANVLNAVEGVWLLVENCKRDNDLSDEKKRAIANTLRKAMAQNSDNYNSNLWAADALRCLGDKYGQEADGYYFALLQNATNQPMLDRLGPENRKRLHIRIATFYVKARDNKTTKIIQQVIRRENLTDFAKKNRLPKREISELEKIARLKVSGK